ncbi:MAG: hypothetical protein WCC24_22705 [Terracidiphilus sp.]
MKKHGRHRALKLEPQMFHSRMDDFKLTDFVTAPVEHELEVTFSSFLLPEWFRKFCADQPVAKLALWTMTQPALKSERIQLRILH